ncbi:MAG: response regulator [Deltaproteobacteria bacterium]|nr:response regulator [Deltaproteobacteria bacterium]
MTAKLLLAEDSLTIQRVFEMTLRQSGISLTVVDNGEDAIRLAKEISPDVVVADVSLPGKDGFEVAGELRSPEAGGTFPVLILAGTLSPFDEERFKKCGANGVLFKPFESQELIEKVESLLRSKEEPAPAPGDEEQAPPSAEEPWDFSDVLNEMEEEARDSGSRADEAEDLGVATAAAVEPAGSTLSLDDFDVSLEDIEGGPEKEAVLPEAEPSRQEEQDDVAPPEEREEEMLLTEEHFEGPEFDDSPPAVTDLTPALEAVEEPEGFDLLEGIEAIESETPEQALPAEETVPSPSVVPETAAGEEEREDVPSPSVAEGLLWEKEFREQFSARAQEIFEKVAAESVEKVMWEVMENLTKEFTEKIRESVEAVAWEVIPATAETLIREEIARIREQAGKESS